MKANDQPNSDAMARADWYVDDVEAGRRLGLSPSYLRKLRVSGGGPRFSKMSARAVRYRLGDLHAWASSKSVSSTSQVASLRVKAA